MTIQEVLQAVNGLKESSMFRVRTADGKYYVKRFFLSVLGDVCLMPKGSRTRGYLVSSLPSSSFKDWVSIHPIVKKDTQTLINLFKKRISKSIEMLDRSGMWAELKEELEHTLSLSEEEIADMVTRISTDSYTQFYCEISENGKYSWIHFPNIYSALLAKRCWNTPRFRSKYHRNLVVDEIEQACLTKSKFSTSWRRDYDNSISVESYNGNIHAFYSEEYLNCGNGHYYILFDATHAVFTEDD